VLDVLHSFSTPDHNHSSELIECGMSRNEELEKC
jgi:hypothetical protein